MLEDKTVSKDLRLLTRMKPMFAFVAIYLILSPTQGDVPDEERDERWKKYISKIEGARSAYRPCVPNNCTCHDAQMDSDFASFWNGINKEDFEKAREHTSIYRYGTHYQIINNRLYRQQECPSQGRCDGIEYFLNQVKQNLPDMEFIINLMDYPQSPDYIFQNPIPVFSFSKSADYSDILFPAWSFWEGGPPVKPIYYPKGIGRWDLHVDSIVETAQRTPWHSKKNQAFFRGSPASKDRVPIILWSRSEPDLVNASYTQHQGNRDLKATLGVEPVQPVKFEDHCEYKYLFNFRGQVASFRFRHLFLCASTVFHVGDEYIEFFYRALKPWVHYVPVKADFSDAKDLLEFFREHQNYAKDIALRGYHMILEHLTMEDVRCYWEKILKKYASLTTWKPQLNESLIEIGVGEVYHNEL